MCGIAIAAISLTGCELGTNPLLFDGSPVTADVVINTTGTSYSGSRTIAPGDVLSSISINVDSVSVINVTLLIDNLGPSTPDSTRISGTGTIDGNTLLTLTNVKLSTFSTEKSIFDPALSAAGVAYGAAGVAYLNNMLKHPNSLPATVTVAVSGTSSQPNLKFTAHVKLYTQVFTTP